MEGESQYPALYKFEEQKRMTYIEIVMNSLTQRTLSINEHFIKINKHKNQLLIKWREYEFNMSKEFLVKNQYRPRLILNQIQEQY